MRVPVLSVAPAVMSGRRWMDKPVKDSASVLFPPVYSHYSSAISSNPSQSHLAPRVTLRTVLRGNCPSTVSALGHVAFLQPLPRPSAGLGNDHSESADLMLAQGQVESSGCLRSKLVLHDCSDTKQ